MINEETATTGRSVTPDSQKHESLRQNITDQRAFLSKAYSNYSFENLLDANTSLYYNFYVFHCCFKFLWRAKITGLQKWVALRNIVPSICILNVRVYSHLLSI